MTLPLRWPGLFLSCLALATGMPATHAAQLGAVTCGQVGQFLIPPASPAESAAPAASLRILLTELANRQAVLLGENHESEDDHRWQLGMLNALYQLHPELAIGFEMFPRRIQPVLDRWVAGQLTEDEFLRQADWDKVWGFDAQLYLPLFRFARQYHLPMLALNVDRGLVQRVRASGWGGALEGVGHPAEPSPEYRMVLKLAFDQHPMLNDGDPAIQFAHFVDAQTLWDRAMGEGIASFLQKHPDTLVVGILGAGHVRHGYGVPHQLQALGAGRVASLVTLPSDHSCAEITPGLADAVFVVSPQAQLAPPPRLGVSLKEVAEGVMIEMVMPGSLAERNGLLAGDIVLQVAGVGVSRIDEVRGFVQRQPAGTWLPLLIKRGLTTQELVVRFPAGPDSLPSAQH